MFVQQATSSYSPTELCDVPLERLEHEIAQMSSHLQAGMCRWLDLVAEFDRREGWGSWGCRSCADWVAWRCAVAPRAAREHVRVARALGELPRIHAAFSRGELSYSKVRALTRVARPDSEADLLEMSRHATAAQLERLCRGLRHATTDEANQAFRDRYLTHFWDAEDGSLCIYARIPAEDGALMLRALEAARDRVWEERRDEESGSAEPSEISSEDGSAEPPPPRRATNADALVDMAASSLSTAANAQHGDRHQVVVHVDMATLSRDGDGACALDDQVAIAPETARRLACDASVIELLERDGEPLAVGRKTRKVPSRLRRALEHRDRTCTFPGCNNRRFLDAHHLEHWARGGSTDRENLALLCRPHHQLVHEGGFSVERLSSGELLFRQPDGSSIPGAPSLPSGDPDSLPRHSGELLAGSAEKLDLHWAVAGLAERLRPFSADP